MQEQIFGSGCEVADSLPGLHPISFCERYIAVQPTPYLFSSSHQPAFAGGVLRGGQAVWMPPVVRDMGSVQAFVDEVGLVLLDPRWLRKDGEAQSLSSGVPPANQNFIANSQGVAMRPSEFSRTFIVMQDVAYTALEEDGTRAVLKSGMLPVGRAVWLPDQEEQLGEAKIVAFAEGLGRIALSRNSLARKR